MKYFTNGMLVCLGHCLLLFSCNEKPLNVPFIRSFTPPTSPVEGIITIRGKNFGNTAIDNLVNINGHTCPILSASDSLIIVKATPGVSSGIISITVDRLAAIAATSFTLVPHQIDSISSYTGSVGDKIQFSGSFFCTSVSDVEVIFDTKKAVISNYQLQNDTTYFSTEIPPGATTGKIRVRIGAVTVLSKKEFVIQ